ncbi:hypothetical protein [Mucilaginibacter sp.]|uniref:hypothetical protein n=1 Tax=Mucilaginibacter sp. TaxID=1882438 RepID=UPI0035BC4CE6
MIVIKDANVYGSEIQNILDITVQELELKSLSQPDLLKLSGTLFEKEVCDTLNKVSLHTTFENKFERTTPHAFPDIIAILTENNWFGVEVKTSQKDWKCFGNSIFESTRIENLDDRIYIFFGNFSNNNLACKWAKYETCIDNINITHSPRYQIDMNIVSKPSLSVFAKMGTTYLAFAESETSKRMEYVRKFKRSSVGQDVALWWLPDNGEPNEDDEKKLVIKLFKNLPSNKKIIIRNQSLAFFPEIFSNNNKTKYSQLLTWLASQHGVVTGSLRDVFSGGGQVEIVFNMISYNIPRVCHYLYIGAEQIKEVISITSNDDLAIKWQLPQEFEFTEDSDKVAYWIKQVSRNMMTLSSLPSNFPIDEWLKSLFI